MVIQTTRSSSNLSAPPRNLPSRANGLRRSRNPVRTAPALDLSTLKTNYDPACEVPKTKRPMGLQEAPTFWPNDKEWADPLGYIASIAEEGKKYGIVKVLIFTLAIVGLCTDGLTRSYRQRNGYRNSVSIQGFVPMSTCGLS